jgi:hypothetical protein
MNMDADIRRITENVQMRMIRGWIDGDPNTLGVRPLTRSHRSYLVQYLSQGYRVRWIVDATAPGILLMPAGDRHDEGDRPDVLISSLLRVLKSRAPNMYRREELARLRESADAEGFDFATLYTLAVRQLGALVEDMAELTGDLVPGSDPAVHQDSEVAACQAA